MGLSRPSLAQRALTSYWAFIDLIEYKGGTGSFGSIHQELAQFVSDSTRPRRMILMPRGHLKSTICSVGYTLWRIWLNPNVRIRVGTASKPLATAFVREVKQYLEDPTLQRTVWNNRPHITGPLIPALDGTGRLSKRNKGDDENFAEEWTEAADKKVVWKADAIQVVRPLILKEPTLVASSVNSPDTGFHCDLFIGDDVVTFLNSNTETKRNTILSWIADQESVVDPYNPLTRLGGESVLLGTRYFYKDLYGVYSNEDLSPEEFEDLRAEVGDSWGQDEYAVFRRNIYVNGTNGSDGYLWPERFNEDVIDSIRRRMMKQPGGSKRFASQYLNQVYSADDTTLDWQLITPLPPGSINPVPDEGVVHVQIEDRTIRLRPVISIDPAISQRSTADNTAITVVGISGERQLFILDVTAGKFTPTETVTHTYHLLKKYGLVTFQLDSEKLGLALKHTFRDAWQRNSELFPVVITDYRAKGDKHSRIMNTLEPLINGELTYMSPQVKANKLLQQEVSFFGQSGVHDDILDSITMGVETATATSSAGTGGVMDAPRGPRDRYRFHSLASMHREQVSAKRFNPMYGGLR